MDLTPVNAPTLLERLFWRALRSGEWAEYLEELAITELEGPGEEPDDFCGIEK